MTSRLAPLPVTTARPSTASAMPRVLLALALSVFCSAPSLAESKSEPAAGSLPSFRDSRRLAPAPPAPAVPASPAASAPSAEPPPPAAASRPAAAVSVTGGGRTAWLEHVAPEACGLPEAATTPLPAGRMQVALASPCRAREALRWRYAGLEHAAALDDTGRATITLDAFPGIATPLAVVFADATTGDLTVTTAGLDRISRVALVWRGPASLSLAAFERGAATNGDGHVASRSPSSPAVAARNAASGSGATGFLAAAAADTATEIDRVAVYTHLHRPDEPPGLVAFAVETPVAASAGQPCPSATATEIPARLLVFTPGAEPATHRIVVALACGPALAPGAVAEPETRLLPALRLGAR